MATKLDAGALARDYRELTGLNTDTVRVRADAVKVEETADEWIVRDTVLTKDGVMNGARKLKEELARTWRTFEHRATVHEHPDPLMEGGIVIDLRRMGGLVRNVRFRPEDGAIVGDVHLQRRATAGLDVTEENVKRNERVIAALRAGQEVEVSIGFWSRDEYLLAPQKLGDVEYDRIQREIIGDHLAIVPLGACSWAAGCGLGRAQKSDVHAPRGSARGQAKTDMEKTNMCEPGSDCANQRKAMEARVEAAEKRAVAAEEAAKKGDARFAALEAGLKTVTENAAKLEKARVDAKRAELAELTGAKLDELPALDEPGLDFAIKREREYRGRADGTRVHRGAAAGADGKPEVVDGIAATPYGFTVVDAKAAVKAAKPGAN